MSTRFQGRVELLLVHNERLAEMCGVQIYLVFYRMRHWLDSKNDYILFMGVGLAATHLTVQIKITIVRIIVLVFIPITLIVLTTPVRITGVQLSHILNHLTSNLQINHKFSQPPLLPSPHPGTILKTESIDRRANV